MTRLLAVVAALAALGLAACGKYGPPQRPSRAPAVAEQRGNEATSPQAAPPGPDSSETSGDPGRTDPKEQSP